MRLGPVIPGPRSGGRQPGRPGRMAAWLMALAALAGLGFVAAVPPSKAVDGLPASADMAQVRIFENGRFVGQGTVVAPNWVLTAEHLFARVDSTAYSLAFGVVDARQDPRDRSNLRSIDRIVLHPTLADVALVHFAQPVPPSIRIPQLAQAAPPRYSAARLFGWGPEGRVLHRLTSFVIDPVASENAAHMRVTLAEFASTFPAGFDPMVVDMATDEGDSGAGIFDRDNVLLGVHCGIATYRFVNGSGNLAGRRFRPAYEEPVWQFRRWIDQVISGEGPSDPDPPHDELKRRRLTEDPSGDLPTTLPPQTDSISARRWPVAALIPESGAQGLVTVTCPTVRATTNTCTQDIEGQAKETIGNDDPTPIRVGSGRQVLVWCRTTGSLAKGAEPIAVVRVSFTNTDTAVASDPPPLGYGWYDVDPTRVHLGGLTIDPTALATC